MDYTVGMFLIIAILYLASLWSLLRNKKYGGLFKRVVKGINLVAFILTLVLILLWSFDKHCSSLTIDVTPFWIFISTSIVLYGITVTTTTEKYFYGTVFFGHLFLTIILGIPFIGIGITTKVYAPFITPKVLYQDNNIIIAEEFRGFLAAKPSPTLYLKSGWFSHKLITNLSPVYSIDSVQVQKPEPSTIEVVIFGDPERQSVRVKK